MANPRSAAASIHYNGKNINTQLREYLQSFSYTDVASGEGDTITLSVNDKDRKWIYSWFPSKGDVLTAWIGLSNWYEEGDSRSLACGQFVIDDFGFQGGPIRMKVDAIATPASTDFKERQRTNTWENTTLENMARTIASRYGMELYYEVPKMIVAKIEQSEKDDCSFLNEMVKRYGYAMKIYKNKIVIFNEAAYEAQAAVATLRETDFEPGWSWDTQLVQTYTGAKYEYTDNDANKTYTVTVGDDVKVLKVSEATTCLSEAKIVTLAKINEANKKDTTMSLTMTLANPKIIATSCVNIEGLGKLNGKYYVEKVTWDLTKSGTKQKLSLRKVTERFTTCTGLSTDVAKTSSSKKSSTTTTKTTTTQELKKGGTYVLATTKKGYYTAAEALAGNATGGHPTGTRRPGTYTIFNISQGMLNLTTKAGVPGSWINPN